MPQVGFELTISAGEQYTVIRQQMSTYYKLSFLITIQ